VARLQQAPEGRQHVPALQELGAADAQGFGPQRGPVGQDPGQPFPAPVQQAQQHQEQQGRPGGGRQRPQAQVQVPGLAGLRDDLPEAQRGLPGQFRRAFLPGRVAVPVRDREGHLVVQGDQLLFQVGLHRHGQLPALGQGVLDDHAGPGGAQGRGHAVEGRAEHQHRAVLEHQGGFRLLGGLGGQRDRRQHQPRHRHEHLHGRPPLVAQHCPGARFTRAAG